MLLSWGASTALAELAVGSANAVEVTVVAGGSQAHRGVDCSFAVWCSWSKMIWSTGETWCRSV